MNTTKMLSIADRQSFLGLIAALARSYVDTDDRKNISDLTRAHWEMQIEEMLPRAGDEYCQMWYQFKDTRSKFAEDMNGIINMSKWFNDITIEEIRKRTS